MEKIIKALWAGYLANVVPDGASKVQIEECRRAFYGGACSLFGEMMDVPNRSDAESIVRLESIRRELAAFAKEQISS